MSKRQNVNVRSVQITYASHAHVVIEVCQGLARSGKERPRLRFDLNQLDLVYLLDRFHKAGKQMVAEQEKRTTSLKRMIGEGT